MKPCACDSVGERSALPTLRGGTGGGIPLPAFLMLPSRAPAFSSTSFCPGVLPHSTSAPLSAPSLPSHTPVSCTFPVSGHHKQMCRLCNPRRRFPTTCGPSPGGGSPLPTPISTPSGDFLRVSWLPHHRPTWLSVLQAPAHSPLLFLPSLASPLPGPRPGPHQYQAVGHLCEARPPGFRFFPFPVSFPSQRLGCLVLPNMGV